MRPAAGLAEVPKQTQSQHICPSPPARSAIIRLRKDARKDKTRTWMVCEARGSAARPLGRPASPAPGGPPAPSRSRSYCSAPSKVLTGKPRVLGPPAAVPWSTRGARSYASTPSSSSSPSSSSPRCLPPWRPPASPPSAAGCPSGCCWRFFSLRAARHVGCVRSGGLPQTASAGATLQSKCKPKCKLVPPALALTCRLACAAAPPRRGRRGSAAAGCAAPPTPCPRR